MYWTPVRIEHRRQVYKFASDKTCECEDQCRERQGKCSQDLQILSPRKQDRRDAGTESECQAQIVEICERYVTKDPWSCRISGSAHLGDLMRISVDPTDKPA